MAWIPIAAAVAGSVASSAMNDNGKGGSSSAPGGGYSLSTWEKMPGWAQDKYSAAMGAMPATANVMWGGATYPSVYGPFSRASKQLWTPAGAAQMGYSPASLSSGLAAVAPWMWMAANNQGMTGTGLQGGAMGSWSNQTPYGSPYSYTPAYSGYTPAPYYDQYAYGY